MGDCGGIGGGGDGGDGGGDGGGGSGVMQSDMSLGQLKVLLGLHWRVLPSVLMHIPLGSLASVAPSMYFSQSQMGAAGTIGPAPAPPPPT